MPDQSPFVGRVDELSQIQGLIDDWEKPQLLFVHGDGGIGKTRLLKEVYTRFAKQSDSRLLFLPIFDFDDRKIQVSENLEFEISKKLGQDSAKLYLNSLRDLRIMEEGEASQFTIDKQKKTVRSTFLDSFSQAAVYQRVVLLFDTTDSFDDKKKWAPIWNFLQNLVLCTNNLVLVLAGRNAKDLKKSVEAKIPGNTVLIDLAPLDPSESIEYMQQKQRQLHISLEPELENKILVLSHGHPILIDLATHWLAREQPVKWLLDSTLKDLSSPSEAEKKEFEQNLVLQISQVRTHLDRLILLLSRVYPLDGDAIKELLKISIDESSALMDETRKYVFVKILPQDRISLHDEMRRMVNEYVWSEIDPTEERRHRDSKWAAEYLDGSIRKFSEHIEQLQSQEKTARESNDAQTEISAFVERESLEHELWDMREQRLYHAMYFDSQYGIEVFKNLFDEATLSYKFLLRDDLLELATKYADELSLEQRYDVENRRVRYFLDTGKYLQAKKIATTILNWEKITIEQQVDMLILLGNVDIRMGELGKAIRSFEEAVKLSRTHQLDQWVARALNALGWAYRNQGDYEKAYSSYREAYSISLRLGDHRRTAWLLNNMGYVNAFRGNRQKALDNSGSALEIWEELGFGRGIGAVHSTLGEIYRRFDQSDTALLHYNKALDIFSDADDIEWMSTVLCGRGAVYLMEGDLTKGAEDLEWVYKNGPENLKPRVLHYQAHIYKAKEDWHEAKRYLEESKKVSIKTGNKQYLFRSFTDLIDIAWEIGEYKQWKNFKDELEKICVQLSGEEVHRLRGSSLRKIGDLAVSNGDYEIGFGSYKEGFLLIAKHEVHSPYTVRKQLDTTGKRISQVCSNETIRALGKDLEDYWNDTQELLEEYPDVLLTFGRWKREGKINND